MTLGMPIRFVNRPILAAALLAGAFGASGAPVSASSFPATTGTGRSVLLDFPSRAEYGVAAHYRAYRIHEPGDAPRLAVLQVQTTPEYLAALHASPVSRATVVYPDGSVQHADATGTFDTATSAYARTHPQRQGQPDVAVRVSARVGDASISTTTTVFAPSATVEAATASGVIADALAGSASTLSPAFAFSCDKRNYRHQLITVTSGTTWRSPTFIAESLNSYYPVLGFCGVENSFLGTAYVTAVRHWSENARNVTVTPGQVPGCVPPHGGPLARGVDESFRCTIREWYADATFSTSVNWSAQPDVALWFEAWHLNFIRNHWDDEHLALLHVQ